MTENPDKSIGSRALTTMKNNFGDADIFKVPSIPKRRSKHKVLEEDTYIEELGKIIQRDFFPDLEKLKAQNEYLEAVERNDVIKLRELHLKYSGKKPPPERIPSPATFETPANIHNSQHTPETSRRLGETPSGTPPHDVPPDKSEPRVGLDQFLNAHTSQDNESFEEIMKEADKRHREKFSYLYNEEGSCEEDQRRMLALPSIDQQCALPEQKFNVDAWGYKNRNYIMYIPDGVSMTPAEQIEMSKKRQKIEHSNTRLTDNPFNEAQSKETICELARSQAKILDGKIGVDGKEVVIPDGPTVNGFGFVATPSPRPGITDSPLMTWGEIEGTPFRLDGGDTPLRRSAGPAFKMVEPTRREQIAFALAEKASERHRDEKKKAIDAARRQFASPSPRPHTSSIDRLASMSPAARRLATAQLKLGGDFRSAATPSPGSLTLKTPGSTPNRIVTPKLNLGIKRIGSDNNLTDDLLNINVPKRQTAADFF